MGKLGSGRRVAHAHSDGKKSSAAEVGAAWAVGPPGRSVVEVVAVAGVQLGQTLLSWLVGEEGLGGMKSRIVIVIAEEDGLGRRD